jgi:hypothetical protein
MNGFWRWFGGLLVILALLGCAPIRRPAAEQPPATMGASIHGRVLWGSTPVAAAQVELRSGAWATASAEVLTRTTADGDGNFVLTDPPVGEYGLVAVWPDGGANRAAVTPVQITSGVVLTDVTVYLVREIDLLAPVSGAIVTEPPTLRWEAFPDTDHYRVWVIDAGTTELLVDQIVRETQFVVPHPLKENGAYTWLVQAFASVGAFLAELENTFYTE